MTISLLRLPEVIKITGLSRSTIYSRMFQGDFPRPVPLGGRSIGWLESELEAWIKQKMASR
jgi:prophage regulatory protein